MEEDKRFDPVDPESMPDAEKPVAPPSARFIKSPSWGDPIGGFQQYDGPGLRVGNRHGFQYVVGRPMTPVLRPLRQSMYDKMQFRQMNHRFMGFVDPTHFPDGTSKGTADTNMTQASQLGTPLEYDLMLVALHPSERGRNYKELWDMFVSDRNEFRWVFGADVTWARSPVSLMAERFPTFAVNEHSQLRAADFPEVIREISREVPLPRYIDMRTPDNKARRIVSTESFRAEVNYYNGGWPRNIPFDCFAVMHGILYAQV